MTLCLVTDRRRLAGAMGVGEEMELQLLVEQAAAAAAAGIDYIQVREPDLDAGVLVSLVRACVRAVASGGTKVLVNDRLDVALASGAAGVHLKEASFSPQAVRRVASPGFVISAAVHGGVERVTARNGADLIIAGTVRPTASKPGVDYLGEEGLRAIVQAAGQPVLGIGGLDRGDVPLLRRAGASGLAAVGAFIPADGADLVRFVQDRVKSLRFGFDSFGERP